MSTFETATANGPSTSSGGSEGSAAQQAKETAQQAAGQAKGRLRDQVDQRSSAAGERVSGVAQDVRSVGAELRRQGKDQPAKLADQAAERAERLGGYLTRADGDTILRDLEDFGRQRPWAVIAGGLALGFAASRFLKASSSRRYQASYESSSRLPARTYDVTPPPPVTPGAPTTRTGMAPGDAVPEYGGTGAGAGLPGRDPRV